MCILPIHTIHAVTVLATFTMKLGSKITALRIVAMKAGARFPYSQSSEKSEVYSRFAHKYACMHTCVYTVDTYDSRSHRSGHIYQEIHVKFHSSANSGQEPDFLIRRAAKKSDVYSRFARKYAFMRSCVYTADTYHSRSDRSGHIYQEIHVKFHSSANSGQEPDFLIRRAAKKVKFIADSRTHMRACIHNVWADVCQRFEKSKKSSKRR